MFPKVFKNSISSNISIDKTEKKFKNKILSFKNTSIFSILIFGVYIVNYIMILKLIESSKKFKNNEMILKEEEANNHLNLNDELKSIPNSYNSEENYIVRYFLKLKLFMNINLGILLIFFFLNIIIKFAMQRFSKDNHRNKVFNQNIDFQNNSKLKSFDDKVSKKNDVNLAENHESKDKKQSLYKKLKNIKFYLLKIINFLLAIETEYQIYLLRIVIISSFSFKILIHATAYLHSFISIIFIYFVSLNYILNFLGFLFGNLFILCFINTDILNMIVNKPEILLFNSTE